MADGTAPAVAETNTATVAMEVQNLETAENIETDGGSEPNGTESATNGEPNQKRGRDEVEPEEDEDAVCKKQKVEELVEEERSEKLDEGVEEKKKSGPVSLGPKSFGSSERMFEYFHKLLHHWPPYLKFNQYEHLVLLELLRKGHAEPDKKIGGGICAFQIRDHPIWKSKCFFLIREDGSTDDFSFRKCVDHILPLPEEMRGSKPDVKKPLGGRKGQGRKGGGGGHGKGAKSKYRYDF